MRQTTASPSDTELLNTPQTAKYLGVSTHALVKWRITGYGPKFCKLGRRILYRRREIDDWISGKIRRSTSDAANRAAKQ